MAKDRKPDNDSAEGVSAAAGPAGAFTGDNPSIDDEAAAFVASLYRIAPPRLEESHPAMEGLRVLWRGLGFNKGDSAEVREWARRTYLDVLVPIAAILLEAKQTNELPSQVYQDALGSLGDDVLATRFTTRERRRRLVWLFEAAAAEPRDDRGTDEQELAFFRTLKGLLDTVFNAPNTLVSMSVFEETLRAMRVVRGRGHRKETPKWRALAAVLAAYGDPVEPATLRRATTGKSEER